MFKNFVLVRSFGIIGGGAVLVAATGLAGVGPLVGEKKLFALREGCKIFHLRFLQPVVEE